ncbi:MAG: hypothetical protein SFT68_02895, partial [Rickettsiaceae bacterium]|nr:hypothetical protein [Rickettsiaceae bacterium]
SFLIRIAANNETICDPKCSIWDGLNPQNLVKPNENKFEIDSFSQRLAGLRNETKAQAVTSAPRRQIGEEFDLDAVEEAGAIEMVEINKYGINGKEHEPQEDKAISSSRFLELLEHSHNPYKEK